MSETRSGDRDEGAHGNGERPDFALDREARSFRYYRAEVERHWDPGEIDLGEDRRALLDAATEAAASETIAFLDGLRGAVARFGAGEQSVTEDLAPLAVAMDDIEDQTFLTAQMYEEARHMDFFDRYWREVFHPVEDELGLDRSAPTDPEWFDPDPSYPVHPM